MTPAGYRVKQFREAFTLIDTDGDGKISEDDLIATFGNLGASPNPVREHRNLTPTQARHRTAIS